ncbi:MAG: tetratricopeptide repeat protein [Wenzhouxiangella sp.]|nr:tetratricopeptide repeat protein [Wenzhouxiangella sp.]TVR91394.1 MAG: hypothetical protein EA418_14130 [Wenzhouxiangellaceae bacterium]
MSGAGQDQLLALVVRASGLAAEQRQAFFEAELAGEEERVEQALRLAELIEEATCAPALEGDAWRASGLPSIPGFELIELIGHGGMGSVFRARQLNPEREVAIKLIRADLVSDQASDRLVREAHLLGRLDHPGIARVYAAGEVLDEGGRRQPWLAMELIEGVSLRAWLAEQPHSTPDVLAVFIRLAEAVQYAHQQGIIHRDLKPANVIVEADGRPRILDFGVARFTEVDPGQATTLLQPGELVGTLGYMAPEQLDGRADTRSDVYALGVMLYQALAGSMPLELGSLGLIEALSRLAREEPRSLRSLRPGLSPELEAAVMHAIARHPDRRYASAAQFGEDLARILDHRPLLARPPGRWRATWLFLRRHRLGVAVSAGIALAVIISAVVAVHFGLREAEARAQAEQRSAQLEAVNRFMQDMLSAADPSNTLGEVVSVSDALAAAARLLPQDVSLEPAVRAELHRLIGLIYLNLARTDEARTQLGHALEVQDLADDEDQLKTRVGLVRVALHEGDFDRAMSESQALERDIAAVRAGHPVRIQSGNVAAHALYYKGQYEEAEQLVEQRLAEAEAHLEPGDLETSLLRALLAVIVRQRGDLARAVAIHESVLDERRVALGQDHQQTLSAMHNLATALGELGERERAEAISRETLARRERVLGRDHPETINTRNNLAAVLIQRGALDEAEPLARSVVDWNVARLGPLHPNSLTARNILAYLLEDRGAVAEAEALYRTILAEVHARGDDALNAQVLGVANNLGMLLLNNDQAAAAADVFAALLPESERLLGHSHPNHAIFVGNHGWCLVRLGRPGEGAELMRASVELLEPVLGPEHPRMLQLAARIAEAEVLALERPVGNP